MILFPISDIDECAIHTDDCHDHATCTDTEESYTCTCNDTHHGDGFNCNKSEYHMLSIASFLHLLFT